MELIIPPMNNTGKSNSITPPVVNSSQSAPSPTVATPQQTQSVPTTMRVNKISLLPKSSPLDDIEFDTVMDMTLEPDVYRLLIFGQPATGKTHFGCTMPSPVIILDSEKRVKLIAGKFSDKFGRQKNIISKQWRNMDELILYTNAAIRKLQLHQEATGEIGTIVIDSATKAWEAAMKKHTKAVYNTTDLQNTKLNPRDDYKFINPIHNDWRDTLMDSGFNVLLTATEGDIYSTEKLKQFDKVGVKPEGQKHNMYAVDYHMYVYKDQNNGNYLGMIRKNSLMRQSVTGQLNVNVSINNIQNLDFEKFDIEIQKAKKQAGIRTVEDLLREEQEVINNE